MKSFQTNYKHCEICNNEATCLCNNCNNYYCDECFNFVHKNNFRKEHKKNKIDYFVPMDTKCQEHPLHPMDLFCADEKGKKIKIILFII
jgi:hypothetical protein